MKSNIRPKAPWILIGLMVLIPNSPWLLSFWQYHRTYLDLRHLIESTPQVHRQLDTASTQQAELDARMQDLQDCMICTELDAHQFETSVVQLVRRWNCQLRQIDVGEPFIRSWYTQDNPLSDLEPEFGESSGLSIFKSTFSLMIAGSLDDLLSCLADIQHDSRMSHVTKVVIRPDDHSAGMHFLEIETLLFGLKNNQLESSDL
ncbi:MAG: hypothetical protein KDA87_05040 [Planctomycetales bacterium]|nr:hypothetical protein [Planctomycetales bacterium]